MNFQDSWLLAHPPGLRQKLGSLKHSPDGLFPPPAGFLSLDPSDRFKAIPGYVYPKFVDLLKLANPKLREEDPSKILQTPSSQGETGSQLPGSPISSAWGLSPCATLYFLTRIKASNPFDSVPFTVSEVSLYCHPWHSRLFLPFNSLTGRQNPITTHLW